MSRFFVYGLVDPRTRLVRYIGKTSVGMNRPTYHRTPSGLKTRGHRANWIKSLHALGLDYEIVILEAHASKAALADIERFWIAYGRASGWPLTNQADGGEGGASGLKRAPRTAEHRAKLSAALTGHKHTAATKAKISTALVARERKLETFAKISAALRGRTLSATHRRRISEIQKGRKLPASTRARMSDAAHRAWIKRKEARRGSEA